MLSVRSLQTYYGRVHVLKAVSLHLHPGEIVAVIGANGAGKTTLLKTLVGLLSQRSGTIHLQGDDVSGLSTEKRLRAGLVLCPEGRKLFGALSVQDNLALGAYSRKDRSGIKTDMNRLRDRFPILNKFWTRPASSLSGGEQQMVALCRALMSDPKILLLDEPSLGLSPLLSQEILKAIVELNQDQGLSVLLVEQNARAALKICHRAYVLETGRIVMEGEGQELLDHKGVQRAYLGKGYDKIWER
ncbi:MAG: ABC transporter ATP-binding protein [Desulfoplanes sp.]|nr:ABC transporter ATP-binding protein [Desulfoplanes sp.]